MTREEALAGHRKMWNEIVDMIERGVKKGYACDYKHHALYNLGEKRKINASCYLCHYGDQQEELGKWSCRNDCIVEWNDGYCSSLDGEYELFCQAVYNKNYTQAAILARKIANLPERVVE